MKDMERLAAIIAGLLLILTFLVWIALDDSHNYR